MPKSKELNKCLVAIRLRGTSRVNPDLQKTFDSLKLKAKFNAILIYDSPSINGMLKKVKDHITWGEINSDVLTKLLTKRGRISDTGRIDEVIKRKFPNFESIEKLAIAITSGDINFNILWNKGLKPIFKLHPPKGGFKKTIKRQYNDKGELGYRGSAINHLLERMI
jgi:large subunit ribosomal protein L30